MSSTLDAPDRLALGFTCKPGLDDSLVIASVQRQLRKPVPLDARSPSMPALRMNLACAVEQHEGVHDIPGLCHTVHAKRMADRETGDLVHAPCEEAVARSRMFAETFVPASRCKGPK